MTEKRFYLHTLGCQMNEYDSDRLAQVLILKGWQQSYEAEKAELLIVNTCTVRQKAEEKAFSLIGRWAKLKTKHPQLIIGMVGCLAQQIGPNVFKRIPAVDFVAGPRAIACIPELIKRIPEERHIFDLNIHGFGEGSHIACSNTAAPISAYVAAMEGCNQFCSYCAVPHARGREKSREIHDICTEIKRLVNAGTKEIVLLGQNVTRYGLDLLPHISLAGLLHEVAKIEELLRIRFLTGHPQAFTPELIETMAEIPQLCEALHLPLQSGSNKILAKMNRGYTVEDYLSLVFRIRNQIPSLALSSDIIVGFPGETDIDFKETLDVLETCQIDSAFCFKYSSRPNTKAASLPDQIPETVKETRHNSLLKYIEKRTLNLKRKLIGSRQSVLIENYHSQSGQELSGRTRTNYLVYLDGPRDWLGKEITVEIYSADNGAMRGKPVILSKR